MQEYIAEIAPKTGVDGIANIIEAGGDSIIWLTGIPAAVCFRATKQRAGGVRRIEGVSRVRPKTDHDDCDAKYFEPTG